MRCVAVMSDYPIIRLGLGKVLEAAGIQIVLETRPSTSLPLHIQQQRCDAIILDVGTTPLAKSLAVCETVVERIDAPPLVGVECCGRQPPWALQVIDAGMSAYVSVANDPAELPHALEAMWRGETPVLMQRAPVIGRRKGGHRPVLQSPQIGELDASILEMLGQGYRDREIAERVGRAESTVKHRIEGLQERLNLWSRAELMVWATEWGYASLRLENERR